MKLYYTRILSYSQLAASTSVSLYFIIGICLISLPDYAQSERPDLYSPVDDVMRLNSSTFKPVVFEGNKNVTYMVQFYNTFCGHCQMFAPIYKEIGTRVKNWTSVVRLAAVDCSKDENVVTCSENKIEGYPTIYIFPPNAKFNDPKDKPLNLRSLEIHWTVDDIEDAIVDYITNLTLTRNDYPLVVNAMKAVTVKDPTQLDRIYSQQELDDNVNHRYLQDLLYVVESEQSYLGRKLILEYYRINSKLEIRRILLSNNELLKAMLSDKEFDKLSDNQPLLIKINGLASENYSFRKAQVLVKGEESQTLLTSENHERSDFIHNRFKTFFEHYYSIELENNFNTNNPRPFRDSKQPDSSNQISHDVDQLDIQNMLHNDPSAKRKVFAIDLLKGITYMITHEIKIKGDLSPSEFNSVRNLLTVLKKYLPLEKWDMNVYKFIVDLRTRLDEKRSDYERNGVKAQEMRDLLDLSGGDTVRLRYGRENWVSCLESDRQQKGYTCSLWLLFHSLTVGEYSKAPPARTKPTMVLFTMRDYITKFLGCTVCASNYEKETEQLESSLTQRNSSVLWLWSTHNRVNQRLNNEKTIDKRKQLYEILFPSYEACSECYRTTKSEIGVDGKSLDDVVWDLTNVFNLMVDTYKPDKVVTPIEMASMIGKLRRKFNYDFLNSGSLESSPAGNDMNKSVEQWNLQSLFTTSDISLCLFLYLACVVMVAIVCVSLKPRWKRFKTK